VLEQQQQQEAQPAAGWWVVALAATQQAAAVVLPVQVPASPLVAGSQLLARTQLGAAAPQLAE
jgi:hypothetical protein